MLDEIVEINPVVREHDDAAWAQASGHLTRNPGHVSR